MLALFLAMVMVLSMAAMAYAEAPAATPTPLPDASLIIEAHGFDRAKTLVVGSTTELNGDFLTVMWGNNAMDAAVKFLINGANKPVVWTQNDGYQINKQIVESFESELDADGNKVYTIKLAEDLVFNDGTPMTVKDYLFGYLFITNPLADAIDGTSANFTEVIGQEAYSSGKTNVFSGLRMLDEYTYTITINKEYVPYFFELDLIDVTPYPMHVIAPGCDIADDGEGIYITGDYTLELLQKTVMDPVEGYRYNPKVSSGPYSFIEFNKESMQCILSANPNFKGDYAGNKPQIETLVFKKVIQATQVAELEAGQVDFLQQITSGTNILEALELADRGIVEYNTYIRNGFGYFKFACEPGTAASFEEVRRAITYCIDRPEFARQFTQGFGQLVYGYYGGAQWMAKQYKEELADNLNPYALSLENAVAELEKGGWTLNEKGEAFNPEVDKLRYKDVDGELMPCKIKWASSVNNAVSDLLAQMLPENMRAVGMEIEQDVMEFAEIQVYQLTPNTESNPNARHGYQMFNLATNFDGMFDPRYFHIDDERFFGGSTVYNTTGLVDQELTDLAFKMVSLDSSESEQYADYWYQWQIRWNELMPIVPLYCNEYFDVFWPKLQNYEGDSMWNWYYAIVSATLAE